MFHSLNPSLFGRAMGIGSESRALRATVSRLRSVCLALLGREPPAFVDARQGLSDLAEQLSTYFDATTSAGHFRAIVDECPNLETRARSVERDREALKQSVSWLSNIVGTANATRIARHIGSLLDRFEEHEHAESDLLRDFFRSSGDGAGRCEARP